MEKLPIIIDLKLHEYLNTNMSLADSSLKQLILDIGRDKIIVNGYNIIGSEEGLDGCIKKISYIIDILTKLPPDLALKFLEFLSVKHNTNN